MLLSLHDRVGVELSPQSVTWVRMARGLGAKVLAKGHEQVLPQPGEPLWQSAVHKLRHMILAETWKGADVTMVLSNHFVRYDCLPWNDAVNNEDEQLVFARHRLTQIYGSAAQAWAITLSPGRKGDARIVAAVDDTFLQTLKQAITEEGIKLHSIQPYLMASFNRYIKTIGQGSGWFVAAEAGRFALALFHEGQWKRVLLRRGGDMSMLHEWLERESLTSGDNVPSREVFLFAPDWPRDVGLPSYTLHRLELPACQGFSPITDGQYAIAMSGVA